MKVQIIRAYDKSYFERAVNTAIENYNVRNIDFQTAVENQQNGRTIIWYIAFISYTEKEVNEVDETKIDGSVRILDLHVPNRVKNVLRRLGCETVDDFLEYRKNHPIDRVRNLGPVSLRELELELIRISK